MWVWSWRKRFGLKIYNIILKDVDDNLGKLKSGSQKREKERAWRI